MARRRFIPREQAPERAIDGVGLLDMVLARADTDDRVHALAAIARASELRRPDANAVAVMELIDPLPAGLRLLVHEHGLLIVLQLLESGCHDPERLQAELERIRAQRQQAWLDTDYIPVRTAADIASAVVRRVAALKAAATRAANKRTGRQRDGAR